VRTQAIVFKHLSRPLAYVDLAGVVISLFSTKRWIVSPDGPVVASTLAKS
jgi:hypothetical protein